ncbi:MAG: response regulator [Planctomycetaceae bacterium]
MTNATLGEFETTVSGTKSVSGLRKVYAIDDDTQLLDLVTMQLEPEGFDVRCYARPTDFLADLPHLEPGVVVTDQCMPAVTGLAIQKALQGRTPQLPMILISGIPSTRVSVQAMRQGAITVLDKPYDKAELIDSIHEALNVLQHAMEKSDSLPPVLPNGGRYLDRLSRREREVIDLVYDGATNKSAGIQLAISIKTVEKHRSKAMKKLEVNSLAELIRLIERERGEGSGGGR